jgi:thiol-disulfide isomerase/thioredoxin
MKLTLTRLLVAAGIIASVAIAAQALVVNKDKAAPVTPETKSGKAGDVGKAGETKEAAALKAAESNWLTDHKKAVELSKKTGKPILFDFTGSDWCPPCKALEKNVFQSAEFKKYSDEKLILLKLDFPNQGNQSLAEKEQNKALAKKHKIGGFPTVLLLAPDGKLLGSTVGYGNTPPDQYLKWLDSVLLRPAAKAEAKAPPNPEPQPAPEKK